ncbi:hypothetical protein [Nonomuraea sp. NPDC002799]
MPRIAGLSVWLGLPAAPAALGLLGLPLPARFVTERPGRGDAA